jgi:hypothetical protein
MNLEVANEGFHVIISSKGVTSPQKLHYLRDGIGRYLVTLNVVSCQNVSKPLRDRQPKPRCEKIPKHDTLLLPGFRRGFLARQPTDPRFKATLQPQRIQVGLGHQGPTHETSTGFNQISRISFHSCQAFPRLLRNSCVALLSNLAFLHVGGTLFFSSVLLSIISTLPLPESLLSSLLEEDEVLPLSQELADQSRPEILPDSELDAAEEDVAAASITSIGAG